MFWDKKKYVVQIKGGKGSVNTSEMRGMVQHLIIRPKSLDTEWDLVMLDKDKDEVFEVKNHIGRLDDKSGLPLGRDKQEKLTISFDNVSKNEPIKVIFKVKELE